MQVTNIPILIIEDNERKKNAAVTKLTKIINSRNLKESINLEFFWVTSYKDFQKIFKEQSLQFFGGYIIDMQFPFFPGGPVKPECGLNVLMDLKFNLVGAPACVFSSDSFSENIIRSKNYTNQFILYGDLLEMDTFKEFIDSVLNYKEIQYE